MATSFTTVTEQTGFARRWLQQPQTLWVRRALFQLHLWTGLGIGVYIAAISISGSALVFRVELSRLLAPAPRVVPAAGERMDDGALNRAAGRVYPTHKVGKIWNGKRPEHAVEISLIRGESTVVRLFDPYTGADMGNAVPVGLRLLKWSLDLHGKLLFGDTGKIVNAGLGLLTMVLCLTGFVVWWPGMKNWRRSLTLQRRVSWKRLTWSVHSAVGFWMFAFLLMWGATGAYLGYQQPFMDLVDYLEPFDPTSLEMRTGDQALTWLGRAHFGRYYGVPMKVVWTVCGLAPALLFATGVIMWWNRVLRGGARLSASQRAS
jgi:uncharacterized iron-regulated membrane protein